MGYDIHITRADNWEDNAGREISAREWLSFVDSDSELERDPSNGDFAVYWRAPQSPPGAWFDWYAGNVFTTNPEPATIEKAVSIAAQLGGRVQGDDDQVFAPAPEAVTVGEQSHP